MSEGSMGKGWRVKGKAKRGYILFASLKLKGGYTSFAVYESFNGASGFSIESLNCEVDYVVPGQPQFKETIPQSCNGLIDQHLPILVNSFYLERLLGQFPLTGGHVMNRSFMRPSYVGSHSH
jgi:hypothetical protein